MTILLKPVMQCPPSLREHQLVAIRQYVRIDDRPALSPPVAVGRMALSSEQLRSSEKGKGKAVLIIHAWKDFLFDMGSKSDLPSDTILTTSSAQEHEDDSRERDEQGGTATLPPPSEKPPSPTPQDGASTSVSYKAGEVAELLNKALLQAISTSLKSLPSSSFPIPATLLYTNHILRSRPAFPTLVVSPASWSETLLTGSTDPPHIDTDITIKTSSHKSLTTFLKGAEKSALLTLKSPQKQQPDVLVTSVNALHPDVIHHAPFVTVRDLELKAAKKAAREEKEKESRSSREVEIKELWKPHQSTVELFEGMGGK